MRNNRNIFILLTVLMVLPCIAQKRKAPVKKKAPAPVVVVPSMEELRFEEMLESTQQIMFIDSVVVDKLDFLDAYHLTSEAGAVSGYNKFFRSEDQPYSTVYVNQLGNKCWYAVSGRLYTSDMIGHQWSEPAPLDGLGRFQRTNYPFMLSDGTTLYFAAISDEGLGGLDIYVSRYDSEKGKYLLAENIGLPFNSSANDYMYAIDEMTGIGYFATDRRQPEGKVCIYTFIPNQKRIVYSTDDMDEDSIRSRAKIDRIADTWGDGVLRTEVLDRINNAGRKPKEVKKQDDFKFIVNDDIVYTSISDFRDNSNCERVGRLNRMRKAYNDLEAKMEKVRTYYATKASNSERKELNSEISGYEQEYYQLQSDIRQLEKAIRYAELQKIHP